MPFGVSDSSSDVSGGYKDIQSKISAFQSYVAVSEATKNQTKSAADSDARGAGEYSKQLSSIAKDQKSFQRNIPTSYEQLLNLIQKTGGQSNANGTDSVKFLRKLLLNTAIQMKPYVAKVVKEEAFKALNCSIQQAYKAFPSYQINAIQGMSNLPTSQTIMVRVEDIDLFQNLKINPNSLIGKVYYDTSGITAVSLYKNYGDKKDSFPMNYELWDRTQNINRSFFQDYSLPYQGISKTRIFDFQFIGQATPLFSTGNFFQVALLDREQVPPPPTPTQTPTPSITPSPTPLPSSTPSTTPSKSKSGPLINLDPFIYSANTIVKSIGDYYDSIEILDTKAMFGTLLNLLTGAFSAPLSISQIENESSFALILNRIFGLCESGEKEIDVSGTAKVSPYDNVDDSFFDLNEADRRNLDQSVNNAKKGVVQYVECNNVELPINRQEIIESLTGITNDTPTETQVEIVENLLDSIPQNWDKLFPGIGWENPWNKDVLNKIPIAMAMSLFASPKVLFPIFMFKSFLENQVFGLANQLIISGNSIINIVNSGVTSGNSINNIANQIMNSGIDFIRKFKKFVFGIVAKISEKFLEVLFETLKKNLLQIIKLILQDIYKTTKDRRFLIIKTLIEVGEFVIQTAVAYRECKSLVSAIQKILKLITKQLPGLPGINKSLLAFADILPGFSPERATINATEILQGLGVPTGPMPDGSPNKMIFYQIATQKGMSIEDAQSGVIDIGISALTGLPIGKAR